MHKSRDGRAHQHTAVIIRSSFITKECNAVALISYRPDRHLWNEDWEVSKNLQCSVLQNKTKKNEIMNTSSEHLVEGKFITPSTKNRELDYQQSKIKKSELPLRLITWTIWQMENPHTHVVIPTTYVMLFISTSSKV